MLSSPVGGLPGQQDRSGQDRVRIGLGKVANGPVETVQSGPSVIIGQIPRLGRMGDRSQMSGGKGEDGAQDEIVVGGVIQEPVSSSDPSRPSIHEADRLQGQQLDPGHALYHPAALEVSIDGGEVMDQASVDLGEPVELAVVVEMEFGEGIDAGLLPDFNFGFNPRRPLQVGSRGTLGRLVRQTRLIHEITAAIVLGTVAAASALATRSANRNAMQRPPLRRELVATDMPSLARFAAFA